jgi:glutaredoxin
MLKVSTAICFMVLWIICLCFSSSVIGKEYVWTDKNGKTHFTNSPPPPGQAMQYQKPNQRPYNYQKSSSQKKVESPKVELYVTSWCPYCKKAIEYFESRDIPYKAYDIEKDENAAKRKKKLDKREGVPFAVINGQSIYGYAPDLYAEALKKK